MSGRIMLMYPPGKAYQRGEDRAQCNLEESVVATIHACNDLGYAAAVLRGRGYEVFLRDYQTEKSDFCEIKRDIEDFAPDMIVISTTNATVLSDVSFVKRISAFWNGSFVLKGAIFFDISTELLDTLDLGAVDYLIGGEIDTLIGDLADSVLSKKLCIDHVPCILYKNGSSFKKTRFDLWRDDLDGIPFPARDLMKNELYLRPDNGRPMATIQTSRGCPFGCTYCLTPIISGKSVRKRSVENVFAEIEECFYKYGIKDFFFKADTFTIDALWAEALCDKIISSDLHGKIEFTVNSRAKPLELNLLKKLKEAGCFTVAIGFESGNDRTLKLIGKGTTREDNLRAARMIKEAKLPVFSFFMIGFPWETKKDIKETLKFALEISPDFIEVHIAMPYYGTELYSQCQKYGTISNTAWGNDYFSPNTSGTATLSMKEIQKIRKRFLLRFYLRPVYLMKKIGKNLCRPTVLKNYLRHGFKLLRTTIKTKRR